MPLPPAENGLVGLLRQCYLAPKCRAPARRTTIGSWRHTRSLRTSAIRPRRPTPTDELVPFQKIDAIDVADENGIFRYASQSAPSPRGPVHHGPPKNIAILGGGIAGLASAFYLSRELPKAKITLYEGSDRLGGWLHTEFVDVEGGKIALEKGPRTLRPNGPAGMVTLALIKQLGLEDELLLTPKQSVSAQNRFVYYPDHLVRMPSPGQDFFDIAWSILSEPVFKGILPSMAFEYGRPRRPGSFDDESVGSFLRRRLGSSAVGDNIVSAVLHGIYAGDLNQLSIKSLLPNAWYGEGKYGSLTATIWRNATQRSTPMIYRDAMLLQEMTAPSSVLTTMLPRMQSTSVYSFKKGISQLSDTIVERLTNNPNITVRKNHNVETVAFNDIAHNVEVTTTENQTPAKFDHVISAISGRKLSELTTVSSKSLLDSLASTHAVTVMVVNLYFPNPDVLPVHGFGYLIPRTIPFSQNPERALGVVFDSDALTGQDTAPGTKITVMLGGHWWDDFSSYPDADQGIQMAKAVVRRHLKIRDEPTLARASLHKECIPQYTVGHEWRLHKAHQELLTNFHGRLAVVGSSYSGVGMNDCVRAARDVALDVAQYEGPLGVTGLEQFTVEKRWVRTTVSTYSANE